MVTSAQCLKKYGEPEKENNMVLWDVPTELEIGVIPKRIYCNKDLIQPLSKAFKALIDTGAVNELKTWDGCFNIRKKRGLNSSSLHSWGIAIDMNQSHNRLGLTREKAIQMGLVPFTDKFVKCFTENGFTWGGDWVNRSDMMHFELANIQ